MQSEDEQRAARVGAFVGGGIVLFEVAHYFVGRANGRSDRVATAEARRAVEGIGPTGHIMDQRGPIGFLDYWLDLYRGRIRPEVGRLGIPENALFDVVGSRLGADVAGAVSHRLRYGSSSEASNLDSDVEDEDDFDEDDDDSDDDDSDDDDEGE